MKLLVLLTFIYAAHAGYARKYVENKISSDAGLYLQRHNEARDQLGLPPLQWGSTVAAYAQNYANKKQAANDCSLRHSGGSYGENIFWGSAGGSWGPNDAMSSWLAEENDYSYATNSCAPGKMCGHYTQIVWKTTTLLGCASVTCASGDVFIICNYSPAGNVIGSRPY